MADFTYSTEWFAPKIEQHDAVTQVTILDNGHLKLDRKDVPTITVAPITAQRVDRSVVQEVLADGLAAIIVLIPKRSHYDWSARELAETRGSSVHTVAELFTSLSSADPRPYLDKKVDYARRALAQHGKVTSVKMLCEASMLIKRNAPLRNVTLAVEYEYEFSQEAAVRALEHHPDADVILNANPNGRPTGAAVSHADDTEVPIYRLGDLMGALNYDGERFRAYTPPKRTR